MPCRNYPQHGTDLAGEIVAIGDGVTDFSVGDEVYGLTGGVRGLQDHWLNMPT